MYLILTVSMGTKWCVNACNHDRLSKLGASGRICLCMMMAGGDEEGELGHVWRTVSWRGRHQ